MPDTDGLPGQHSLPQPPWRRIGLPWVSWVSWVALLGLLFMVGAALARGQGVSGAPSEAPGDGTALVVYVRDGCPHCAKAKVFLDGLRVSRPELRVVYRPVDADPAARDELMHWTRSADLWPPGVPTFVWRGQVIQGFDDAEHSGRTILALIGAAPQPDERIETRVFGALDVADLGLPAFTLVMGLLDGFNPCAMWVLLFLLSLLVRLHDRRRMALIAGTFVLVSGAVYYAFMAAWLNIFLAVGLSTPIRWTLALVALGIGIINIKDWFAWGTGPSLSIPESAKPGLYARVRGILAAEALTASLVGVAALAVVVNFVELLCTAGLPAITTAVLAQHDLTPAMYYAYLGLYILGYIADDSIMVAIAVIALGNRKLTETAGRRLKLLSGAVMVVLGLVLLLRPQWLV